MYILKSLNDLINMVKLEEAGRVRARTSKDLDENIDPTKRKIIQSKLTKTDALIERLADAFPLQG